MNCNRLLVLAMALGALATPTAAQVPDLFFECRPLIISGGPQGPGTETKIAFSLAKCNPPRMSQAYRDELAAVGIRHYGLDTRVGVDWQKARDRMYSDDKALALKRQEEVRQNEAAARVKADEERKEKQAKVLEREQAEVRANRERNEAAQAAKQAAVDERARRLRSGDIKIASLDDAITFHDPVNALAMVMIQPLLKPDNGMYAGAVLIDAMESDDIIRVKLNAERGSATYAFLKIDGKSVQHKTNQLRVNGAAGVVGRYVGNQQYKTVNGQSKTAPVLVIAYIGPE